MNNFKSIYDNNIQVNNIDYHLELPVTRRLDVESVNKCISGVFIASNFNISKGIEMRYKRVDNYTEMMASEALIMDLINNPIEVDVEFKHWVMNTIKKEEILKPNKWIRLVFMVLYAFAFNFAVSICIGLALVQFLFYLFTGKANPSIANFNSYIIEFYDDTLAFLLFETEEKPFPFKNEEFEEDIIDAEVSDIEEGVLDDFSKDTFEENQY